MQTIAYRRESNTFVLVHGEKDPTDKEWEALVEVTAAYVAKTGACRSLVVTPGSGPNMRQRKQLNDALGGAPSFSAILTGSAIARTVVSILRLRNPEVRAFELGQLEEAFTHLQLDTSEKQRIGRVVQELRQQLGFIGTL